MTRPPKIGPWEIQRKLAKGGFAQVYLGRRQYPHGVEKTGVLKVPLPGTLADADSIRTFRKEAAIAMKLAHNNIVSVIDVGEHQGVPYLVMEYIAGLNVSDLTKRLRLAGSQWSIDMVAHVIRELLYALEHAHSRKIGGVAQQIVHRDIKPANVMVSESGGVHLTDFGIAAAVSVHSSKLSTKGTLGYMAPEHLVLGEATHKSDLFGVGAIMWEMLECRRFREGVPSERLQYVVATGEIPPLTRPGIPAPLRDLCLRLLSAEPDGRPPIELALDVLEGYGSQRSRLSKLCRLHAGKAAERTGHTKVEIQALPELDRTFAVAAATREPDAPVLRRKEASSDEHDGDTGPARLAFLQDDEPTPTGLERVVPRSVVPAAPIEPDPIAPAPTEVPDDLDEEEPRTEVMTPFGGLAPTPRTDKIIDTIAVGVGASTPSRAAPRPEPAPRSSPSTAQPTARRSAGSGGRPAAAGGLDVPQLGALRRQDSSSPIVAASRGRTEPAAAAVATPARVPRRRVWPVIVGIIAAVAVAGIGLWLSLPAPSDASPIDPNGSQQRSEPQPVAAAAEPMPPPATPAEPDELGAEPASEPTGTSTTLSASAALPHAGSTQGQEDSGDSPPVEPDAILDDPTPAIERPGTRKPAPRAVTVKLKLGFVERVDVKLDGEIESLHRARKTSTVSVPAGRTRVRWRFDDGDEWRGPMTFDLPARNDHTLVFGKDGPRHSVSDR